MYITLNLKKNNFALLYINLIKGLPIVIAHN